MGFIRFHRQLRFGIFRVNFSKTGIGYGIGWRGFSLTKTASGKTRMTNSMPGTGFSYINEFGNKNDKNKYSNILNKYNNLLSDDTGNHVEVVSESKKVLFLEIMNYIDTNIKYNIFTIIMFILNIYGANFVINNRFSNATTLCLLFFAGFILSLIVNIYHKTIGRVQMVYSFDDDNDYINDFNQAVWRVQHNNKIWRIDSKSFVNGKERSAATYNLATTDMTINYSTPYFIKSNYLPCCLEGKKIKYYLFPDCVIVVDNKNINIVDYHELKFDISGGSLILLDAPADSYVKSYTWQHVNNNGSPDRRFAVNHKMSIIVPGIMLATSKSGFNICMYFSSIFQAMKLDEKISEMIKKYDNLKVNDLGDDLIQ